MLTTGNPVQLLVREIPGRTFPGFIARTAKSIDLQMRTMRVEVEQENKDGLLLPSAFVQIQLAVQRTDPPLMVPASALIFNANGAQLATVDSQSLIELKAVTVEADQGGELGIASGISVSDRVVINPGERLSSSPLVILVTRHV